MKIRSNNLVGIKFKIVEPVFSYNNTKIFKISSVKNHIYEITWNLTNKEVGRANFTKHEIMKRFQDNDWIRV